MDNHRDWDGKQKGRFGKMMSASVVGPERNSELCHSIFDHVVLKVQSNLLQYS